MPTQKPPASAGAVLKKLTPGTPGTRRLHERYGAALVCVRYRQVESTDGARHRQTTVELIIDERPVHKREVWLRIAYGETQLRRAVKEAGGKWDSQRRLWRTPAEAARKLELLDRVINPNSQIR